MNRHLFRSPVHGLAIIIMLGGCAEKTEPTYQVTGKVTVGGQPVDNALVTFVPKEGRPVRVTADASGAYTAMLAEGDYRIAVEAPSPGASDAPAMAPDKASMPKPTALSRSPAIPESFWQHETSGLKLRVVPGEQSRFDIRL